MDRNKTLRRIEDTSIIWDIVIIGGGATGLGTAVDAASRSYNTLLVEQSDFGKGTSSRSTKLAHGGVRYLQQGNISLVLEALKERGIMKRNAPHLVNDLEFVVPTYDWWQGPFYGVGLKLYDMLAGNLGLGDSKFLSREETIGKIPTIETKGLRGGIIYHDGQFDDARLLINLAQTAYDHGAAIANYVKVISIHKNNELIDGVTIEDQETGKQYAIKSKVVINATGVFTDNIRKLDDAEAPPIMTSSQGVHIVLDKHFLPGDSAIMVPQTDDGRVLFAVPWYDKIIVGTTDTPVDEYTLEPVALKEEIEFLLNHASRYLITDPTMEDIKSVFVGLRPLVREGNGQNTAAISREHTINISRSGLVSIAGGKWTTYRKMAEDTMEQALMVGNLEYKPSNTETLHIYGYHPNADTFGDLKRYGSAAVEIEQLLHEHPNYKKRLHPEYTHVEGEVIWAVKREMARGVEDFLARRTRLLFLDVEASLAIVSKVASITAKELGYDKNWEKMEIENFNVLATAYKPKKAD